MSKAHDTLPSLTFPAPLFRHIAPELYLHRHLQHDPPLRPSGRAPAQHRPFTMTTSSLSHAHGSAVIRIGDTAVVCGVRGEILTLAPGDEMDGYERYGSNLSGTVAVGSSGSGGIGGAGWGGLVVPNIELSTGCSKRYPLGPPSDFAQALAQRLNDLMQITKIVDLRSLRIYNDKRATSLQAQSEEAEANKEGNIKGYWTLYVDVLCISLDGNILDAAWMAIVSALNTTKLPYAYFDTDEEQIKCSSHSEQIHGLVMRNQVPVLATFAVVSFVQSRYPEDNDFDVAEDSMLKQEGKPRTIYLNDPDAFEESETKNSVSIVLSINSDDNPLIDNDMLQDEAEIRIERIEKYEGCILSASDFKACIEQATTRAKEFITALRRA